MIAEFAVTEFAAAVGLGTESGKHLIGEALELRHRLPKIWARVQGGQVQAWRARRIAAETMRLSPEAAAHVDRHLAPFAHSAKPWQLDRLVADAIARHMPDLAEDQREARLDRRHVRIDANPMSMAGTAFLSGELDLVDAHDLEHALRDGAEALKAAGSEESLDVRRSIALGDLARGQQPLNLEDPEVEVPARRETKPQRQVILHLHLSEAATTGWVEEDRLPVTADTIKDWVGRPDIQVIVKPVIDLNSHHAVDGYQVPDRIREQVVLRDRTCVFPHCTRPARSADVDHITPYDPDGPPGQTATDNLACLCRGHHRLKTHSSWTYTTLEPGVYLWHSPTGLTFLRDHHGTTDLSRD